MALVPREPRTTERKRRQRHYRETGGRKKSYRVRARDERGSLVYFKTRTKLKGATIKRLATVKGLHVEDVR
jgi:hypothetical protein